MAYLLSFARESPSCLGSAAGRLVAPALVLAAASACVQHPDPDINARVSASVLPAAPAEAAPAEATPAEAAPVLLRTQVLDTLRAGECLSSALARHTIAAEDIAAISHALQGHIDARSLRAGQRFVLDLVPVSSAHASAQQLRAFELHALSSGGVPRVVRAQRAPSLPADVGADVASRRGAFDVTAVDAVVETVVEGVSGAVQTSIYQALLDAGEDANLVSKFVDIFAWNVDFYRQSQKGDEFRLLVQKRYVGQGAERRFLGYGAVLAAEYVNHGSLFRGFRFQSSDQKHAGTYDSEGNALERTFLKSPLAITQVTSRYGMRFHPVLGKQKKHEGVDYGAPSGTPVWSVADGVVREARYSKTAGNMVRIEHMNGVATEYFHLTRHAPGIKPGTRVKQKQVIGTVGSTGMSTGPHLHFGMLRGASHVDPQKQKFQAARPVPREYRVEFDAFVKPLLAELKALGRV